MSREPTPVEVKLFAQIGNGEPLEIGVLAVETLSDFKDFVAALNGLNDGEEKS